MDYIRVVRARDLEEITIAVAHIVAFWDINDITHISLVDQEYIETAKPISAELRKHLNLVGNRITKVGD